MLNLLAVEEEEAGDAGRDGVVNEVLPVVAINYLQRLAVLVNRELVAVVAATHGMKVPRASDLYLMSRAGQFHVIECEFNPHLGLATVARVVVEAFADELGGCLPGRKQPAAALAVKAELHGVQQARLAGAVHRSD